MKIMASRTLIFLLIAAIFIANSFAQSSPESIKVNGPVNDIKYSPDGRLLAVATSQGCWLYNAKTLDEVKTLIGHEGGINALMFSDKILASAGMDKTVKLWNSDTGECLSTLQGHLDTVKTLAFSMDGETLASADVDMVLLWNTRTSTMKKVIEGDWAEFKSFPPIEDPILALAFSQNGSKITRRTAYTKSVRAVHPDDISISNRTYSTGGSGQSGNYQFYTKISALELFPNSETFATAEAFVTAKLFVGTIEDIENIAVHLWTEDKKGPQISTNHEDLVNVLVLSPKGDFLATGSADKTIQLLDIKKGELRRTLEGHTDAVTALAFAKDGTLASGSKNGTILIWKVPVFD